MSSFCFNPRLLPFPSSSFLSVSRLRRKKVVLSVNPPSTEDASSTDHRYGMVHESRSQTFYSVFPFPFKYFSSIFFWQCMLLIWLCACVRYWPYRDVSCDHCFQMDYLLLVAMYPIRCPIFKSSIRTFPIPFTPLSLTCTFSSDCRISLQGF